MGQWEWPTGWPGQAGEGQGLAGGRMSDGEGRCTELVGTGGSVTFISTQCSGVSSRGLWGSSNHLCNSCHSTLCKEFYYFVHFIKKKVVPSNNSRSWLALLFLRPLLLGRASAQLHPQGTGLGQQRGLGGGGCSNSLFRAAPGSAHCSRCQGVGVYLRQR